MIYYLRWEVISVPTYFTGGKSTRVGYKAYDKLVNIEPLPQDSLWSEFEPMRK